MIYYSENPKKVPYSADYVTRMFKEAVKRKRLNTKIHFHSLRHSYITNLANSEVPLPIVQQLAGHSNITPQRWDMYMSTG